MYILSSASLYTLPSVIFFKSSTNPENHPNLKNKNELLEIKCEHIHGHEAK